MKLENENISTPVYLKTDPNMPWPKDKMFYILSSDGLFLCRNHEWFQSCSLSTRGPGELEKQKAFARLNYPKIPKAIMERALSFFRRIDKRDGWESALLLVWNRQTGEMDLVCPDQKASSTSVEYDIPKSLPQHLALIGDIHSHPHFSPSPSFTDEKDEKSRPGLHIVAGYINRHNPEFHCEAVMDGTRFNVNNLDEVLELPESCDLNAVPQEWLDKVKKQQFTYGNGYYGEGWQTSTNQEPRGKDEKIVERVLREFMERDASNRPTWHQVKQALFSQTKLTGYVWCETRATKFMEEWDKAHDNVTTQ